MSKRKVAIIASYALIALFAVSPLLPMLTIGLLGGKIAAACWIFHHFYLITVPVASLVMALAVFTHVQHHVAVKRMDQRPSGS